MSARKTSFVLSFLLGLFFLRVLGQIAVALWSLPFLPPMEAWYSGLMPYPLLLPSQIIILGLFAKIAFDLYRGHGFWFRPRRKLGLNLLVFGSIYFLSMIARFAVQGISIPVLFHWVLAGYTFVWGWYHFRQSILLAQT